MACAGGLAASATGGVMIAVVAVALIRAIADPDRRLVPAMVIVGLAVVSVAVGSLLTREPPQTMLTLEAAVSISALGGYSRRQFRQAEVQSRALLLQQLGLEREKAQGAVLAERQHLSRDIHDVLAHSLGGLIVQLDAAQALLVAGKTAELASRLHDARDLAVSGFSEARHAVDTLGEDESLKQVTGDELRESLSALVRAHRGLGRTIEFESGPLPQALGEEASRALRRALQESLTNARKHAPSSAVSASVHWDGSLLTLEVSNPLAPTAVILDATAGPSADPLAGTGMRRGIAGMRARFNALTGTTISAGPGDGTFVVRSTIELT